MKRGRLLLRLSPLALLFALPGCPELRVADGGISNEASMDALLADAAEESSAEAGPDVAEASADVARMDAVEVGPDAPAPVCSLPIAGSLTVGGMVMGTLMPTGGTLSTNNCASSMGALPAAELVYRLTVATRTFLQLSVSGVPSGGLFQNTVSFSVRTDCTAMSTELACGQAQAGLRGGVTEPIRTVFEPGTYYVVVDGRPSSGGALAFTLSADAQTETPVAAGTCAGAVDVPTGSVLMGQTTAPGTIVGPRCGGLYDRSLYYRVSIPAGQRAVIAASPVSVSGTEQLQVQVSDACDFSRCLDVITAPSGMAARSYLDNPGTAPRVVYVAVAQNRGVSPVGFTVGVSLTTIPYTVSMIPSACENLSTATFLGAAGGGMGSWTDDSSSSLVGMPFAFQLMGDSSNLLTVCSNGFVQLQMNSMGVGRTDTAGYRRPPSPDLPGGLIAPFWYDLGPVMQTVGMMTTSLGDVRYATFGAAPSRRFVVGWSNFTLLNDPLSRLAFQVKLFEQSNVVEFHYCTLSRIPGDAGTPVDPNLVLGSQATLGMQNFAGNNGFVFAHHEGSPQVSTVQALRFTPH